MNKIIKVSSGKNGIQTVNARELHEFLESGQQFADWIKGRIEKYGFTEHEDFEVIHNSMKNLTGGRPETEYHISLNMAKELSMVENNEKGKQARRYFIDCEKAVKAIALSNDINSLVFDDMQKMVLRHENTIAELQLKLNKLEKIQLSYNSKNAINTKDVKITNSENDLIDEVSAMIEEIAEEDGSSFLDIVKMAVKEYDKKYDLFSDNSLKDKIAHQEGRIVKAIYLNANIERFIEILEDMG